MRSSPPGEGAFLIVMDVVVSITWIGVFLAQVGAFSIQNVALGLVGLLLLCAPLFVVAFHVRAWHIPNGNRFQYALLLAVVLLAIALDAQPAEHYPLVGDSAIYPNTAALLSTTGRLQYAFHPFDGLSADEKHLFYVRSDEQILGFKIEGYQGLLYGTYYITDIEADTIVSSRPAGFIAWMAIFYGLFGSENAFWATPLFGVLSVVAIYLIGARLFGYRTGIVAALLLALCFPQIHFARTSYSEAMAQAVMLTGLYALCAYLAEPRRRYLFLAVASFGAAWLTRLDALAVVVPVLVFVLVLLSRRDGWGTVVFVALLLVALGFWATHTATSNAPYVIASLQLFSRSVFSFLQYWPWLAFSMIVGGLLSGSVVYRHAPQSRALARQVVAHRLAHWAFAVFVTGAALYLYFLAPQWSPQPGAFISNDVLFKFSLYLTPLLIVAAALGLIWCFAQRARAPDVVVIVFGLLFGALFLTHYTSAPVYPVSLRRLTPEVLPCVMLFAAYTITACPRWPLVNRLPAVYLRFAPLGLSVALIAGLLTVSGTYIPYRESAGATQFVSAFAAQLPRDAVIIFEPLSESSQVGWFAAPLWSLHDRHALLLARQPVDAVRLDGAIAKWQAQGKPVYYVSAQKPLPITLAGFVSTTAFRITWESSIIGQSTLYFPPYIWRFAMPFEVYRLTAAD